MVFIGLAKTWLAFATGKIDLADLAGGEFYFECSKLHFFGGRNDVPFEATWGNEQYKTHKYPSDTELSGSRWSGHVPRDLLDDNAKYKWEQLEAVVRLKTDTEDVHWNSGNAPELASRFLGEGKDVYGFEEAKESRAFEAHR